MLPLVMACNSAVLWFSGCCVNLQISQMTSELELIEDIAGLREGAKKRGGTLTQEKNHLGK